MGAQDLTRSGRADGGERPACGAAEPGLRLRLLGGFQATLSGGPEVPLALAGRRRALLAYLAMQPRMSETRERLADLLWGERPDRHARQSLRQCLLALRRELGPIAQEALVADADVVKLRAEVTSVDAREVLEAATADDLTRLERAAALCEGEFLAGLDVPGTPFSEWLQAERPRIGGAALRVLERCTAMQEASGAARDAVRTAERLVALDPLREASQRLLIELYARHVGRQAALAQFDTVRRMLEAELSAEPERATLDLAGRIEATPAPALPPGPPAPEPEPPPQLPPPSLASGPRESRPGLRGRRPGAIALAAVVALAGALAIASTWLGRREEKPSQWASPSLPPRLAAREPQLERKGLSAIIVLPFATLGEAGPGQLISARLTHDLTTELSRVPVFRVISAATASRYRDQPFDPAELGVHFAVEGAVGEEGGASFADVALVEATSKLRVWTQRFAIAPKADTAAVGAEIVRAIARRLHVTAMLEAAERPRPAAGSPAEAQVGELLRRGWAEMLRIGVTGRASKAGHLFEQVLARDPSNASALTGLGAWNASLAAMFLVEDREAHVSRAESYLGKALEIEPRSSVANYFMGIAHKVRGEPQAALDSFRRSLHLNPSFASAYAQVGHVLARLGEPEAGLAHILYAIRLSPRDPNLGLWSLFAGQIELERGRDAEALRWLEAAVDHNRKSPFLRAALAAALALNGRADAASRERAEAERLAPWLKLADMERRIGDLTVAGRRVRMIEGLRLAFQGA